MDYSTLRYRSADDRLDLFARDYGGPPDAPALLLMHGLTRNSADFEPLVAHLAGTAGRHHRLIVPDQRGRGLSPDDPDPANYRNDFYALDMFALLDTLGIERAGLIGTSMGGLMAMIMGAMQPARIPAMVLNDIGPQIDPDGLARIAEYVGKMPKFASWEKAAAGVSYANGAAFPDFTERDWMAFARRICREDAEGHVTFAYDQAIAIGLRSPDHDSNADEAGPAAETPPADLWPLWEALDAIPTLVIRGALSDLLTEATVDEMERRHHGPFQRAEIPSRGHAPLLDEPDAVAAIDGFLATHWPA